MSDREPARHRSPQRPVTFLADAGDAVSGRLAGVGRSGAVIAASTGILATGGIPVQAYGAPAPAPAAVAATSARAVAAPTPARAEAPTRAAAPTRLRSVTPSRPAAAAALTAPLTATVAFETTAFRADPTPIRPVHHAVSPKERAAVAEPATRRSRHLAAPARSKPAAENPVARKPVVKKPFTSNPVRKKPVTKPPVTKKPAPTPKPIVKSPKPAPSGAVRGSSVLAVAARYVGTPYRYGGTTPSGFDCSGFTQYVYRQLGISLPRTADQQMKHTRHVTRSQARAGDLVFFVSGSRAYHVGIYAGGGKIYDSPRTGKSISKRAIWDARVVYGRVTR